jgi:hypothetical protein
MVAAAAYIDCDDECVRKNLATPIHQTWHDRIAAWAMAGAAVLARRGASGPILTFASRFGGLILRMLESKDH